MSSKMRSMRRILPLLLIGIVALLAVGIRLALYTPPEESTTVTRAEAERAGLAVRAFEDEVSEVYATASKGARRPFEITLRQEDITGFLRSDMDVGDLLASRKMEAPKVRFQSGKITSSAYITIHGRRLYVTMEGGLRQSSPGKLVFKTTSVKVGRLPASTALAAKVDDAVNAYMSAGKLPARIEKIEAEDGKLVVSGVSDPNLARR